ncbi:scopoletin glucosyltransferase-like [Phoenix dactylifera]|uniref:Glycosyltransferase n=1 Tax=Phoenix dactylifera TaxID=42345 RepID=A0A8B9AWJ6_PHODC|nr:scopoletin glucosyltransferase-like [Phoenix dactylifera]
MADSSSIDKGGAFPHVLRIYFIPFPSPGHIIPMVDIAKLFAERGADAVVVLTPLNAARFGGTVARAAAAGHRICLHVLAFPSAAGLPDGCESTDALPSRSVSGLFARALDLLQDPFQRLVRDCRPDAVVSDVFLPWTATAAAELGIPRYAFTGTGCFALSVERSLHVNRPQDRASSNSDPFLVPGLPDRLYLTRSRLAEATLPDSTAQEFLDRARKADRSTAGWVVNTFPELEPGYLEHYERETGKRVFAVGPVSLCNRAAADAAERGRGAAAAVEAARILTWLDSKPAGSVIYVCFGSLCRFPVAQMKEIGMGLEESRVPFLWAIGGAAPTMEEAAELDKWVEGMEGRVGERGMIVRGWAAQVVALGHAAVGGFMTHCGWGAAVEAAAAGVPALTWPLFAEQFYNEALVVGVVGTGAAVGAAEGFVWGEEEKAGVVVGKARIATRVAWLMGGAASGGSSREQAEGIRRRAREIGDKARRAVAAGGSSYLAVGHMMEDIRRWNRQSAAAGSHDRDRGD